MSKWKEMTREQKVAALRDLIEVRGMSASQAGAILGTSRNAVIGQCGRDGIQMRPPRVANDRSASDGRKVRIVANNVSIPPPAGIGHVVVIGRPLEDIPPNGCKWPINDGGPFLFCCAPRGDHHAYCHHHAAASISVGTRGERDADRQLRRLIR